MNGFQDGPLSPYAQIVSHRTGKFLPRLNPEERIRSIWIYGLFDVAGFCHYAGQTKYPKVRAAHHWEKRPGLQFRVLRRCLDESEASRIENQIIKAFWKRGQCKLNKQVYPFNGRNKAPLIYSDYAKRHFSSTDEAALFFNCSTTTITNQIRGKSDNYFDLKWSALEEVKSYS